MPPPETYKSEIGSQLTMYQVHTGAYVSLLAPENLLSPGFLSEGFTVFSSRPGRPCKVVPCVLGI